MTEIKEEKVLEYTAYNEELLKKEAEEEYDKAIKNNLTPIVSLRFDKAFKIIFNKEKRVLLRMLRDVLGIEVDDNSTLTIGEELLPPNIFGKMYRLDVRLEMFNSILISIEMNNNTNKVNTTNRNMLYLARNISGYVSENTKDEELENYGSIMLNLNRFRNSNNKELDEIMLLSIHSGIIASKLFKIYNLDIDKCYKLMYNNNVKKSKIMRWGSIFRATSIEELSDLLGGDLLTMEEKEHFLNTVREANDDRKILREWQLQDAKLKIIEENNAEKRRIHKEGIKQGKKEDKIEGIQEVLQKGAEESKKEVIINMLRKKLDYDTISEVTGKAIEEIKKIEETITEEDK